MSESSATDSPPDRPSTDGPKVRACLRCRVSFESQWSGERICSRCKSSHAWRAGSPFASHPSGSRR